MPPPVARKRIALLGASGYAGQHFAHEILRRGHLLEPLGRRDVDLDDSGVLRARLEQVRPDFLVNCAGYTGKPNVDACEEHKAETLVGNAVLPGMIARACQTLELPWGHLSSGCIYTGAKPDGTGFTEEDPPNFTFRQNNCSFYSGTKALGEEVLAGQERCYIWRLRMPFSNVDSPRNYLSKLLGYARLLEARNSLSHLPEVVAACVDCIERNLPFGTYNLTNPGSITTREVTQMLHAAGLRTEPFQFFASEEEFLREAALAPRSNCVLDASKALAAGLRLTPLEDALRECLAHWQPAPHRPRAAR